MKTLILLSIHKLLSGNCVIYILMIHEVLMMRDCTILRLPAVQAKSGYSRSTIYVRINQGLWTKPIHLGERSIGWPLHEVITLNHARVAGLSDNEIRLLVKTLEADRKKTVDCLSMLYPLGNRFNDSAHDNINE